jgi:hypothetical protein
VTLPTKADEAKPHKTFSPPQLAGRLIGNERSRRDFSSGPERIGSPFGVYED